jgi:plasmid stabilization system protein ParE
VDFKIVWTLRSRQDLRNIASFIAKNNPPAALKFGDLIFARVDTLEKFPEIGRIVPERGQPHIREIVVRPYRIIYRLRKADKLVEVLRVWHGARGEPEI